MTVLERQLLRRLEMFERRIRMLEERSGLNAEAIDAARLEEALDLTVRTGDPEMIKEYCRRKRKSMCSPEFMTVVTEGEHHG